MLDLFGVVSIVPESLGCLIFNLNTLLVADYSKLRWTAKNIHWLDCGVNLHSDRDLYETVFCIFSDPMSHLCLCKC
jgi:hypothetical protein